MKGCNSAPVAMYSPHVSALLSRHPRHEDAAAVEVGRNEYTEWLDDINAVFSVALQVAQRAGNDDAARRIRAARSALSERLGLTDR